MNIDYLLNQIRCFSKERDWEQFHSPKNIAISISVESSELLEIFQWTRGNSWGDFSNSKLRKKTEEELADIFIYLLRFADLSKIDLEKATLKKIEKNKVKYPVSKFKGSDMKYNEL